MLAVGLLCAWLSYLITAGQPSNDLSVFKPTLVLHALYAALFLAYGLYLGVRRRLPGPTRLDAPIAALVLVYAGAITTSIYPRLSLEATILIGAVILTFYACHDFDFISAEDLIWVLVGAGTVAATLALYHLGDNYLAWLDLVRAVQGSIGRSDLLPPTVPRIEGVGDHVNVLAMALNLTLPFAFALLLTPGRFSKRFLGSLSAVLILVALFFTVSRGAWLGTIAAAAVFALLYALRARDLSHFSRRFRAIHLAPTLGLLFVVAVLALSSIFFLSRWDSRPEWLFRASLSPRQDAAEAAIDMVRDEPWLGTGPYTYSLLYNVYSGDYPKENIHPHNGYLNVLVDTGFIGGAVLLAGGLILLATLASAFQSADAPGRTRLAACAAALTSLAVHSLLDSPNIWGTALLPLAVVIATTLRLAPPLQSRATSIALIRRVTPAGAILLLALTAVYVDRAHADYAASLEDMNAGRFTESAARAADAASADPRSAAYQLHAGLITIIDYFVRGDRGGSYDQALVDRGVDYFRRTVELEPRSSLGYMNLALGLQLQGDGPGAVIAAHRAIALAPSDGTIAAAAGTVFEWAGREEDAVAAYAGALSRDSGLVQSPFWTTTPERRALRDRALAASSLTPCQVGRMVVMYPYPDTPQNLADSRYVAGLASDCKALVEAAPGDARARSDLAVILHGIGRDQDALTEAKEAVHRVPDNAFAHTALGIVIGQQGDIEKVRHELTLATYLGDPDAALFLAYTYDPPTGPSLAQIDRLQLLLDPGPMPPEVIDRLRDALPNCAAMVYDGRQIYLLGILYYRVRFQRESPPSMLVPGDWLNLASPRSLAIMEALSGR